MFLPRSDNLYFGKLSRRAQHCCYLPISWISTKRICYSCVGGGNDWYFIGKFARRRQHGVLNQELGGLRLNSGFAINFLGDFELKFPHCLSDNSNSLISRMPTVGAPMC